jgi:hypothetical protein
MTLKEANQVVDISVKHDLSFIVDLKIFNFAPSFISLPLLADNAFINFAGGF